MRLQQPPYCYMFALVASLLVFVGNSALAQSNWVPNDYFGIPSRDKHDVFLDEFEDNRNKWDLGTMFLEERIQEEEYYCHSLTSRTYVKHRPIAMNQSGNYEIEIQMRYVKGSDRSITGLTFGRDLRGNEYNFLFNPRNPKSRFKISQYDHRGRTIDYQAWKYFGSKYTKHSYNKLMVRKVSDTWHFFINERLVHSMKSQPLFGNEFGFIVGGNTAVEVDYIRVSEIRTVDNMGPQISILEPRIDAKGVLQFKDPKQIIRGKVYDVSGISNLTINGEEITITPEGVFTASLRLPDHKVHNIEIVASDRFKNKSEKRFAMQYVESSRPIAAYSPNMSSPRQVSNTPAYGSGRKMKGKNYLLLIGVNEYSNWNRLHNAVKDCNDLAETLTSQYKFEPENVLTLFNGEATRENILETFEKLQESLSEHDNLLIYYAGHGFYDPQSTLGYWVPVNARLNKIPDFIRNSTIHDYLRTINTKNTLLIADACYAGSLFSLSRGTLNENFRSRWAFTSGDIEKVWDGQPGQNSPFARYLIRFLRTYDQNKLRADFLIEQVGLMVQKNTAQTPKGSALKNVGDENGIFVFYRR